MKTLRYSLLTITLLLFAAHAAAAPIVFQSDPDGWIAEGNHGAGTNPAVEEGYDTQTSATISMWYPAKAAFRAGHFTGADLGTANIGDYSVAFGLDTLAEGDRSMAVGRRTDAIGLSSLAGGYDAWATGQYGLAYGHRVTASGSRSAAFNHWTTASGYASTAMGRSTHAIGSYSTATGYFSTASGTASSAWGYRTQADSYATFAIGRYNVGGGSTSWVDTDPLFEVGNGTGTTDRANAFTVYKNGDAEFAGTVRIEPSGDIGMGQFTSEP